MADARRLTIMAYISQRMTDDPAVVDEIFERSRINNAEAGITGLLFVDDRSFLQVLEGEARSLGPTVLRIAADHRHSQMRFLLAHTTELRLFSQWGLGRAAFESEKRKLDDFARALDRADPGDRLAQLSTFALNAQPYTIPAERADRR